MPRNSASLRTMLPRVRIFSHNRGSQGAKNLAEALSGTEGIHSCRILRDPMESSFRPRSQDLIINWGNSVRIPDIWNLCRALNRNGVTTASNKLEAFSAMQDTVRVPEFTNSIDTAKGWTSSGIRVFARKMLRGSCGDGIVDIEPSNLQDYPVAPLYVQYVKKTTEYRIHVMRDREDNLLVIDAAQKKRRRSPETEVNSRIRNLDNGWVFCREGCDPGIDVQNQSVLAIEALDLDFGAVDVIWNEHQQKAYVLEVNTAPGLEGTTVTNYANAIRRIL